MTKAGKARGFQDWDTASGTIVLPEHAAWAVIGRYDRDCTCRYCRPQKRRPKRPGAKT